MTGRRRFIAAGVLLAVAGLARADGVGALRAFARDVQTARAQFTQVVTSPDGARRKTSSGRFEFARPDRFRFAYDKPYQQTIVADGRKVWLYDVDLNQVTVRAMSQALGATPAALLAGAAIDREFVLSAAPERDGLQWAQAVPKAKEGTIQTVRVGFNGATLAALEIVDSFGQRSMLSFTAVEQNVRLPDDTFRFVPPPGADVIEQ
jgi:outer membrane lipoprotein carrier protein